MSEEKIKIARRKNARVIPYGYEISEDDPEFLIQNEDHMELIKKAKKFIENNCSYRETAEWLSHNTGRKLTGMGLREVLKRVIHKGW
tara:strand:+ start:90 stop:350 length:261 start_codon:yes stop_codon:yes gene_type:complete